MAGLTQEAKFFSFTDINECSPNPCQYGGTCTDGVNTYLCTCVAGYTGTTCATGMIMFSCHYPH